MIKAMNKIMVDKFCEPAARILREAKALRQTALTEPQAKLLLAEIGISVPPGCEIAASRTSDLSSVASLRPPLAAKIISSEVLHKSDSGGVILNLKSIDEVAAAIDAIAGRHKEVTIDAYLVEEMVPPGIELVIGGTVDESFGPVLLVGIGGIFIEVLNDVNMRLCPITRDDAYAMLQSLRGVALLRGARGLPAVNIEAVVDAMLAIGGADGLLMNHQDTIASVDINPMIASAVGCVAADARVLLQTIDKPSRLVREPSSDLRRLLMPRSIAVVGASSDGTGPGNTFIRNLQRFGYTGALSIVHPSAEQIDGVVCYPTFAELPQVVDYAYVAIPAARVPALLAAANHKVAFAQVMSSGFAEIRGGEQLQADLLDAARHGGVRVVGPNCLGLHSTLARVTFIDKMIVTPGNFGVISQSGGMGVDMLRRGQALGVRFSQLVTLGNAADVSVVELLKEFLSSDDTKVIGLYLESVPDARELFDLLRARLTKEFPPKPILLLKGGTSAQGQRAAQSHTGALTSDERLWTALAEQAGVILVDSLDAFIDVALTLQLVSLNYARPVRQVCLFGNGGGTSVVACDTFARQGLAVTPFSAKVMGELDALRLPPGASVANPIDTPVGVLNKDKGAIAEAILQIVHRDENVDAIVFHLNLPVIVGYYDEALLNNLMRAAMRARHAATRPIHFLLVLRSDGSEAIDGIRRQYRKDAIALGIPVFDEMPQAAGALAAIAWVERYTSINCVHNL